MPGAFATSVNVPCPETILPPEVPQDGVKLAPVLEPVAFSVAFWLVQVSTPGVAMATVGNAVLLPTVVVTVDVHPLLPFVTCKVYVPALLTVGVRVVAPVVIWPPFPAVHK